MWLDVTIVRSNPAIIITEYNNNEYSHSTFYLIVSSIDVEVGKFRSTKYSVIINESIKYKHKNFPF